MKSSIDRKVYSKQRNLCVRQIRREKKKFFSNINTSDITDDITFWKKIKPFFAGKVKAKSKIKLIDKKAVSWGGQEELVLEKIISEDQYLAEFFHKRRMTMKAFVASEFGYCPLVWIFDGRKLNSRVNKLHEGH